MFNVFINDGKTELPNEDVFYIIAKDGIFLRKKVGIVDSLIPVDKISTLHEIEPFASLDISKIDAVKFAKILQFFKDIYNKYKSECIALLYYDKSRRRYRLYIPHQKITAASIDYVKNKTFKDYNLIGTIHSHAGFSAFHSGTDKNDEASFDGIHITVGNINDPEVSIEASVVVNGSRFTVNPLDYVEDIVFIDTTKRYISHVPFNKRNYNKEWLEKIEPKIQQPIFNQYGNYSKNYPPRTGRIFWQEPTEDEWNPCFDCPFKDYRKNLQPDILDQQDEEIIELTEEDLVELGFEFKDDEDENVGC